MSRTATQQDPAGSFATSRRGGLTSADIIKAEALRRQSPPVSFQNIAKQLQCCQADLVLHFAGPQAPATETPDDTASKLFPWNQIQVAYLKAHYIADGPTAVARVLGCTKAAANKKACRLGVTKERGWVKKAQAQRLAA